MRFQNIAVAVDFSEHSDRAIERGAALAKQFGAKLHLVHVYGSAVLAEAMYGVSIPTNLNLEIRDAAAKKLEAVAEKIQTDGIDVESHLIYSTAAEGVAQIALKTEADLVVVGTRGLTGLKHLVLGSVAERIVRTAPCSVLVVRDDEDTDD